MITGTYIGRWPRRDRLPEKVLVVVVEPDEEARLRCLHVLYASFSTATPRPAGGPVRAARTPRGSRVRT